MLRRARKRFSLLSRYFAIFLSSAFSVFQVCSMFRDRSAVFTAVLLSTLLVLHVNAENQCGGSRILPVGARINATCDTNLQGSCPFGRLQCVSPDAVKCVPDCLLRVADIIADAFSHSCPFEGAELVCSPCPSGYTGPRCDSHDPCAAVDCGFNGKCSPLDGSCLCDNFFSGKHCELHAPCSGRNHVWTGTTCMCAEGYVGPRCDRCDSMLVCLPNNKTNDFTSAYINDAAIINKLLSVGVLPGYTQAVRRPNASSPLGCACAQPASQRPSDDRRAYNDDSLVDNNLYLHHHYEHVNNGRGSRKHCYSIAWMIADIVFIIVFLAIFIYFLAKSFQGAPTRVKPSLLTSEKPPKQPIFFQRRRS